MRMFLVTVNNQSGRPATLVVGMDGMFDGHPTRTVNPSTLPPGITEDVVIGVPPGIGWAIYINPGPDWGASITSWDVPPGASGQMPFSIVVSERGDGGADAAPPGWFGTPTPGPPTVGATWTAVGDMVRARSEFTATLPADGKVLVVGGLGGGDSSDVLSSAELYDPDTTSWTAILDMSQPRWRHTTTRLGDGRVLVVGGYDADGHVSGQPEIYDPRTRSWAFAGDMVEARAGHSATLLPNGKVLVAGGSGPEGPLATAELFDPAGGGWSETGNLATARYGHTATLLSSGGVLVAGGCCGKPASTGSRELASAEVYDPASASWAATGSMVGPRTEHTATLLLDGTVLVAGGRIVTGAIEGGNGGFEALALASAERYDPRSGSWTATEDMTDERSSLTATLLADGTVLVAGGGDGLRPNAELYGSGAWTATMTMTQRREGHTATLLLNGLVLVAGGSDPSASTKLASAELYDPEGP